MWWRGQSLDKPIDDKSGRRWHFLVWHGHLDGRYLQRIFFWCEDFSETGILELSEDQTLHVRKLRQRISMLAKDPEYRRRFKRPLQFPIERHYP